MCDRGNLLLAAILLTALYQNVAEKLLDFSPDAIDYICSTCRQDAIEKYVKSGLLDKELSLSQKFHKAWNMSSTKCPEEIKGGIKEHTVALLAYANGDRQFIQQFNNEVETMGGNITIYDKSFNFKAFHFLLVDYMMLQRPQTCQSVYVLTEDTYTAIRGSIVRLGRFTTAETNFTNLRDTEDLGGGVILNITSCLFAKLGDNICKKENQVLLSPSEQFTVENVIEVGGEDGEYTLITLNHLALGDLNKCHICSRSSTSVSTQWPVLVMAVLSFSFFTY